MPTVKVTDRDGGEHEIEAYDGTALMEALRDSDLDVLGTCGGTTSCGTCHVYIRENWLAKLQPRNDDEQAMLEAIGELVEVKANSRLSCQIEMNDDLAGLEVTIGPVA